MKKVLILLCIASLFVACADEEIPEEPVELTKAEMLASEESKVWLLFAITPEEDPCAEEEEYMSDNTWTFFADGTFKFDHGTVTESEICQSSDFINLTGSWEISEDGTEFASYLLSATDNPEDVYPEGEVEYIIGTIVLLEENKFLLSTVFEEITYTYEFRLVE